MAKILGSFLGLSSLLYSIILILNGWHRMSQSLKIFVLIVPSIFVTIAALFLLFSVRVLIVRLYRRVRGTRVENEFAFMDSQSWRWVVLPIWLAVATGLYGAVEHCCG